MVSKTLVRQRKHQGCQILICSFFHPTPVYYGHNSHVITHYISSRLVNSQSGSVEKLELWKEAKSSKGGLLWSLSAVNRTKGLSHIKEMWVRLHEEIVNSSARSKILA